ncbi:hypothetical protein I6F09_15175 [Bradyrhizobium sp. IC3195]|uniref:DUF6625 family protein n=1 Tax=Bradyrhizobium sp. IC3195 TaxID=2793804 RepID=UPI001CD62AAF|nr:DUF6625 family protein [Bradyrhizobium sp. IC3195]MCA1469236.1 hypothetical protein [Bradyrhizobium sp. IC3195]
MTPTPAIVVIAAYFGQLPNYLPLWLMSCRYNPQIRWRLITDAAVDYDLPINVSVCPMSLGSLADRISDFAGVRVALSTPYKLCDLRPLFSALVERNEPCDFWGHCDLDMLFGDLASYIRPNLLANFDKIFSVGHFTLYRNNEETNTFYRRSHPELDWRRILSDPNHFGFDEHIGVNRIWLRHGGKFHSDESVVADIDPHISRFERTNNYRWYRNYRHQAFCFDRGRTKRLFWKNNVLNIEEFMYVHFQKRHFPNPSQLDEDRFYVTPRGFIPIGNATPTPPLLDHINDSPRFTRAEIDYRVRRLARIARQGLLSRGAAP